VWVILDTTFRRGTGKKSVGLSTPSPSPTKSASFTYDRIPDSLSPTPSPISHSSSNGFRSRSPSLEFRTTLVDPGAVHLNGSSVHYRECFNCKMPIFDVSRMNQHAGILFSSLFIYLLLQNSFRRVLTLRIVHGIRIVLRALIAHENWMLTHSKKRMDSPTVPWIILHCFFPSVMLAGRLYLTYSFHLKIKHFSIIDSIPIIIITFFIAGYNTSQSTCWTFPS